MKTPSSALLPVLRSDAVGRLLALLFLAPDRTWTLGRLATAAGVSMPTTTREVTRMVTAGILREERVGRTRQISANTRGRLFAPLTQLVTLTYGPVPVLEDELRHVDGVETALIYGSWAARHEGVQGPEPRDVDVLAIGSPDPDDLYQASESARRRLGRDVTIHALPAARWADPEPSDPFLRHVRSSPMVNLDLDGDE